MTISSKIPWPRILAEGSAIVVSILLAFAIQAWWETSQSDQQRLDHLMALERDFEQMSERATASYENAERAIGSGIELVEGFKGSRVWKDEAVFKLFMDINFYEVFSPSVGGYESLVGSGAIELIEDRSLKRELAAFFGSFEDMRVSERALLENIFAFLRTPLYADLVGIDRLPIPGFPEPDEAPMTEWSESRVLLNWVSLITINHMDVKDDYEFLRERIERIQAAIRKEIELH